MRPRHFTPEAKELLGVRHRNRTRRGAQVRGVSGATPSRVQRREKGGATARAEGATGATCAASGVELGFSVDLAHRMAWHGGCFTRNRRPRNGKAQPRCGSGSHWCSLVRLRRRDPRAACPAGWDTGGSRGRAKGASSVGHRAARGSGHATGPGAVTRASGIGSRERADGAGPQSTMSERVTRRNPSAESPTRSTTIAVTSSSLPRSGR